MAASFPTDGINSIAVPIAHGPYRSWHKRQRGAVRMPLAAILTLVRNPMIAVVRVPPCPTTPETRAPRRRAWSRTR